jgi:hypothetical protein
MSASVCHDQLRSEYREKYSKLLLGHADRSDYVWHAGRCAPLIAVALEMRRRGHTPVLAVPEIFRPKVEPLGLEFARVGPTLNPEDPQQVADLMDKQKGTERTLWGTAASLGRQWFELLVLIPDLKRVSRHPIRSRLRRPNSMSAKSC